MSDTAEKLRQELQAVQRALAETKALCERHEVEHQAVAKELEDNRSALLFMLEDLENARRKIEQAHQEWMDALDVVDDPIFLHDKNFRILRCNRAYQQCAGIPFKQIIGRPYYEIFPKADAPLPCCLRAMEKAEEAGEEAEEEVAVGNTIYRSRASSISDEQGAYLYSVHTLEDITERKKAEEALKEGEEALRKSNERFDLAVNGANDGIWDWNIEANTNYFSPHFLELLDYGPGELAHELATFEFLLHPEDRAWVFDRVRQHLEDKIPYSVEYRLRTKNGKYRWFQARGQAIRDQSGKPFRMAGSITDITERRRVEVQLKNSEERYRQITQTSMDGFWMTDTRGRLLDVNDAYCQLTGYTREELLNMRIPDLEAKETPEETVQHIQEVMTKGHVRFETRHRRKDGQLLDIEVSVVHQPDTEDGCFFIFLHDVTGRKQAEAAVQHANRALATLSAVNRTLVRAASEDDLLQSICQAIVRQRSYLMAWVGYTQYNENKSIKIMASAGHDEGYLDAMQLTWAETERGMGPSGRAVRSGTTQLCQDMANDPLCLPWRDAARQHGYAASIALPLLNGDNTVFGILNVYAEEVNAFTPAEIDLLEEMAGDLAFGVRTLHTRHERDLALEQNQRQLVQLQDSLEDTVRAIASIVEMRDPYTAGHQSRVADLAAAIAKQIGMSEEQMHAIHLAGVVHDLGKINIPAEILSRPGKISGIEFSLIKIHPQAGYDILKGINFPWPIAKMVLQHHERLDGSGYPQGLKGDEIILEARILSVADVVEAIASHRPYRPSLGIEAALAEISQQRGIHFDTQVVDACLALFREQGYTFK